MLSANLQQKSILKRIEQVVSVLTEESSLFKEQFDNSEIVNYLYTIIQDNLTTDQLNDLSDEALKEICSSVMSIEVLSKIEEDLTSEQVAIFDEVIKRK